MNWLVLSLVESPISLLTLQVTRVADIEDLRSGQPHASDLTILRGSSFWRRLGNPRLQTRNNANI
jgi:hypothetical protein